MAVSRTITQQVEHGSDFRAGLGNENRARSLAATAGTGQQ